jgi:short-subunit dehydrogenase
MSCRRDLKAKVIVITGASSGIGRATALAFAAEGANLHMIARREDLLNEACREAEACGAASATAHVLDICNEDAFSSMAEHLNATTGGVDVLINNAGVAPVKGFLETTMNDWAWTFDVNVHAMVRSIQLFLPKMLERGHGTIVNLSSIGGILSNPLSAYCASKHAVVGLSESLTLEFGDHGIDIIVVCPGMTKTEMLDAAKLAGRATPKLTAAAAGGLVSLGVSPDVIARDIVKAVQRPKFMVLTPTHARVLRFVHKTTPGLFRKLLRRMG